MKIEEAIEILNGKYKVEWNSHAETKEALQTLITLAEQHKEKFCECSCNKNGKSNWQIRDEIKICSSCLKPLAEQHKKPSREEIIELLHDLALWRKDRYEKDEYAPASQEDTAQALLDKFWGD